MGRIGRGGGGGGGGGGGVGMFLMCCLFLFSKKKYKKKCLFTSYFSCFVRDWNYSAGKVTNGVVQLSGFCSSINRKMFEAI